MADHPSYKFKLLNERCICLKWNMQRFLGLKMDLDFINSMRDLLVETHEFDKQITHNFLRLYCNGEVFDRKIRYRLVTRIAYFYDDFKQGVPVGEWKAFTEGEWVAAEIVKVVPITERDKHQVLVYFLIKAGSAAGHILYIQLSYGKCSYMAYLLGYSVRKQYDREDPRGLLFMQCVLKVGAGDALSIRETAVASAQVMTNSTIAKCRAGDCPLDLTINCSQCSRKHGEFAPSNNYCEGSMYK
jgi:hypothetical protein